MSMENGRRAIVKWVVYAVLLIVVFLLQEYVFSALRIFGVCPILMGSLAVCVGMNEGAGAGAVYGAVCGAVMYARPGSSELMYALVFAAGGVLAGVLCENILTKGIAGALLLSLATNALATLIFFIFVMWIPGRAGMTALIQVGLVEIAYSTAGTLVTWAPTRFISRAAKLSELEEE